MGTSVTKLGYTNYSPVSSLQLSHEAEIHSIEQQVSQTIEKFNNLRQKIEELKKNNHIQQLQEIRIFCKLSMDDFTQKACLLEALHLTNKLEESRREFLEKIEKALEEMETVLESLKEYKHTIN